MIKRILCCLAATVVLIISGGSLPVSAAMTQAQYEVLNSGAGYYNICEGREVSGGGSGDDTPSALAGNNNEEKIWNYFVNAGIPGVSDNAAAIAGIMGNLQGESGFEPYVRGGGGNNYYGIFQGNNKSYSGMIEKVRKKAGDYFYITSEGKPNIPDEANNKALQIELDTLVKSARFASTGSWKKYGFLVNLDKVENKTAEAYSELFLVAFEGAYNKDGVETITDSGVQAYAHKAFSKHRFGQGAERRRDLAKAIYEKNASSTTGGSSSSSSNSQKTVFLDPGHGGGGVSPGTEATEGGAKGVKAATTSGHAGEAKAVLEVANRVKTRLEGDGYKVVMSRTGDDKVENWKRGVAASKAGADIGVSIHTDDSSGGPAWNIAYQEVGAFRLNTSGDKVEITNSETAEVSKKYAEIFKTEREKTGESDLKLTGKPSSSTTAGGENTLVVMLSAQDVPWVYNERAPVNNDESGKAKYAEGLYEGIKASLGSAGGDSTSTSADGCTSGNDDENVGGSDDDILAAAERLVGLADGEGCYKWGGGHSLKAVKASIKASFKPFDKGVDCSGFVAAVIYEATGLYCGFSASDQTGPGVGSCSGKFEELENTSDAQPGDIFNTPDHAGIVISREADSWIVYDSTNSGCGEGHGPAKRTKYKNNTSRVVKVFRYKGGD